MDSSSNGYIKKTSLASKTLGSLQNLGKKKESKIVRPRGSEDCCETLVMIEATLIQSLQHDCPH